MTVDTNVDEIVIDARSFTERFVDGLDYNDLAEQALVSVVGAIATAYVIRRVM